MRLLIFVDWFLPGYKAGGQISSCSNIVYALSDSHDIYIITRDRDLDDTHAYAGTTANTWTRFDNRANICYLSPEKTNYTTFKQLVREVQPDTVYFNSMFSFSFTLLPLVVLKAIGYSNKTVLAPRGMLQAGALQFRPFKKKAVLTVFRLAGFFRNIIFHATDETEAADIKRSIKGHPAVQMVYDFPAMLQPSFTPIEKQQGYLKCLFVSRVVQKKNLLFLIKAMAHVSQRIDLTIAGPIEDLPYWNECLQAIKALPEQITVQYIGSVPNSQLGVIYQQHHLFVLPTLGENFGHVIFDAFINGRPVLISNKTPWQNLSEKKAGRVIDISEEKSLRDSLAFFAAMDNETMAEWCRQAWLFGHQHIEGSKQLKEQYKSLFS